MRPGQAIDVPVLRQRIKLLEGARETGGQLVRAEITVAPHTSSVPLHTHPRQEEQFEILAGRLCLRVAGEELKLAAGQQATIPAGTWHRWWNESGEELVFVGELRPALRSQEQFETYFRLGRDGKLKPNGFPHPLQAALLALEFQDEIRLSRVPFALQKILFLSVAPLARLLGYRVRYP